MQNGREPGPDDVQIEGEETRENIERPVEQEPIVENTRPEDDRVGSDEEGVSQSEIKNDPDALRIETDDEAAPEDPDEAQSPT